MGFSSFMKNIQALISPLPAGTNVIGKVGIDQTIPGTTNKVVADVASSALPAGAATSAKQLPDGHNVTVDNTTLDIAKGNIAGTSFIHKFGTAPDFDTADNEVTVWDGAEDNVAWEKMVYTYSSTADIQYISSNNGGDTVDIEVLGLDSDWNLVTQTKTLTGQTSAQLDTPLIRVFRMKNMNGTALVGHVFCSTTTAPAGGVPTTANIRAIIQLGNEQTEMSIYTIPNGKTGYMDSFWAATAGANKTSNYILKLKAKVFGGVFQLKHRTSLSDTGTSHFLHPYKVPEVFAAKTDIEMTTQMLASGGTEAAISAGFDLILVDD